jgi:DNA helicase-2/ATP-dependent DNA helicase PcrA
VTRARLHVSLSWALSRSPGGRGGRRPSRFLDGLRPGSAPRGARGAGSGGSGGVERGSGGRKRRGPVLCRVCGRTLSEAGEIKLMRCEDCPSDLDEGLYERLRAWRMEQAKALGQPAYCVFTDKTLLAIAEVRPEGEAALSSIAGVGARKLDKFGADVLALCAGEEPGVTEGLVEAAEGSSEESAEEAEK